MAYGVGFDDVARTFQSIDNRSRIIYRFDSTVWGRLDKNSSRAHYINSTVSYKITMPGRRVRSPITAMIIASSPSQWHDTGDNLEKPNVSESINRTSSGLPALYTWNHHGKSDGFWFSDWYRRPGHLIPVRKIVGCASFARIRLHVSSPSVIRAVFVRTIEFPIPSTHFVT